MASLRERYLTTSTSGLTVFKLMEEFFKEDALSLMKKLVKSCNETLSKNPTDFTTLDKLYTLLCCEYQLIDEFSIKPKNSKIEEFDIFSLLTNALLPDANNPNDEKKLKIFDVIILQLAIHSDDNDILHTFKQFYCNTEKFGSLKMIMDITRCLIDAIHLNIDLYGNSEDYEEHKKNICELIVIEITAWFSKLENTDFQSFISLITKMIFQCDSIVAISSIWILILTHTNQKESLKLFCTLTEDFFSLKSNEEIQINLTHVCDERFWEIIKLGLTSNVQQQRKQARQVMKRALEFFIENKTLLEDLNGIKIPFIDIQNTVDWNESTDNFFLLLESLEEKQSHLVLPAMPRLKILLDQRSNDPIDSAWINLIFQRIFSHNNNAVLKSGLLTMLKKDPTMFNEEFLLLLMQGLKNTFLYDGTKDQDESNVPKALSDLFIRAENKNIRLINDFIITASKVSLWPPAPMFWMIESLRGLKSIKIKCNEWNYPELEALTIIVNKSVAKQSKYLRRATLLSLSELLEIYAAPNISLPELSRTFICNDFYYEPRFDSFAPYYHIQRSSSSSLFNLVEYTMNKISKSDCNNYLLDSCTTLMDSESQIDIDSTAKIFYLIWRTRTKDSMELLFCRDQSRINFVEFESMLSQIFGVFNKIDETSASNTILCERSFELIANLAVKGEILKFPDISMESDFDGLLKFILKNLDKTTCPKTYESASIFKHRIDQIFSSNFHQKIPKDFYLELAKKSKELLQSFNFEEVQFWHAAGVLSQPRMRDIASDDFQKIYNDSFLLDLCQKLLNSTEIHKASGKYISEHYKIVSELICLQLRPNYKLSDESEMKSWLLIIQKLIEVGNDDILPSLEPVLIFIMSFKNTYVYYVNASLIKAIIDLIWKQVWSMERSESFHSLRLCLLCSLRNGDILKYINRVLERTDNNRTAWILYVGNFSLIEKYRIGHAILSCVLDINCVTMEKRIEGQILRYMDKNLEICIHQQETQVRIHAIDLIIDTISSSLANYFVPSYVSILLSKLVKLKNKRYFANSNLHFLKNRIMQVLLILQPYFSNDNASQVHKVICQLLLDESNQPSVRVMQEWLLIRIHIEKPILRDEFWENFDKGRENRPGSITSFASIVYHVYKCLPSDERCSYFEKAVENLLPSCMAQQFVVRLYCQRILLKLFKIDKLLPVYKKFRTIKNSLKSSLSHGNLTKNSIKLFDNFYFAQFDPLKDYNFMTIFYDLPRLFNVSLEECLSTAHYFVALGIRSNRVLPYHNKNAIKNLKTPSQDKHSEYNNVSEDLYSLNLTFNDIQKNVIPLKSGDRADDNCPLIPSFKQQILSSDSGMIVVASLIDGLPNLGGLARTCEIFCARELVLESVTYTKKKDFQSLSVSSEKWVSISEVKPHKLRDYLLEKRSMGWSLIGAEQTANSVNIHEMEFPKKTVLLLGNEKNGIPANLIPLLDMCVEIPQGGVVRSLNVHVTGAICLWQYAKHHIFIESNSSTAM